MNESNKYYLVFSDEYPHGIVLTAKQAARIKGYKYTAEIEDSSMIPLINELLDTDLTPEQIVLKTRH